MFLQYTQFLNHLEKNKIYPVYLFSGEEDYLKQEVLKKIEKIILTTANKEFNYNFYSASDTPPGIIISILTTLPFLAEKRLVVVENIEDWKEKEGEQIVGYLDKPSVSSCLVLTTKRIDFKNPLLKKVNRVGMVVNFSNLAEKEILSWIRKRFSEEGKTISLSGAELLFELTGNNLFNLNNEIKKICLYSKEKKEINEEIVSLLNAEGRVYQINELLKVLFEEKPEQVLKILNNLLSEGEEAVKILGAISRRIREFIYALSSKEEGLSNEEIMMKLKIYKFYVPLFFEQIKKFDQRILVKFLEYCLQADYEIKTGKKTGQIALENLVLKLCGSEESIKPLRKT